MRESSGRTSSSKRPLSRWWIAVTWAWKRRPLWSTSTMSPFAMPFDVSRRVAAERVGGTGRRLVCSIARATLLRVPDGLGDCRPHPPVQRDVLLPVGADEQQRGPRAADRPAERGPQVGERRGRLVREVEQGGGPGEVEAGRRRDVLLEGVGLGGDRQEVEDAAAAVVDEDDRQRDPRPRR